VQHNTEESFLHHYLKIASRAVKKSASGICHGSALKVITNLDRYVKVAADMILHETLVKIIGEETPFPVYSEEKNFSEKDIQKNDYHFIIDPLDGSLNYSRSLPLCCISIALWKGMSPLLGVVYDFNHDEIYQGLVGEGAWLNGTPISVAGETKIEDAILCTGFPTQTDFSAMAVNKFVRSIQVYKKVRLIGSAALSLAFVSSGRADAYHERDIAIWDVGAGIALVKAAGGFVEFSPSTKKNRLNVFAASTAALKLKNKDPDSKNI